MCVFINLSGCTRGQISMSLNLFMQMKIIGDSENSGLQIWLQKLPNQVSFPKLTEIKGKCFVAGLWFEKGKGDLLVIQFFLQAVLFNLLLRRSIAGVKMRKITFERDFIPFYFVTWDLPFIHSFIHSFIIEVPK